ncbi:ectonucleoside triphosphate diphosphohydrolase 8 isoform X2 [Eptesicus fuscus]|uniref:ectonucleoside triphosphate diphosphohydrolase 8 isoform X2 n=1 Tax=Eptesicus fuscus TaxID=29078 RepID=UPI0024044C4F|nr:ectonucleoside triphosphate diphosphohydrolase 8 isoform X2 [Eptesicus fuscus]
MKLTRKEQVLTALLGTTAALAVTALVLTLVQATSVLLPADTKFGIVLDAGSSHTSLFVYRWPADKENDTGVVSQALACRVKGPGISSYASDPAQAGESLRGCLEEALAAVPEAQQQRTPMFLGATAGMRLLSQKNSSQAGHIFAAVAQVLGRAPVAFGGAELLAGRDEGALGWITVNYVLGLLVKYSFSGEWIRPPEGTLVGALDMGGASTQITFVPGGPIRDESTQASFRLYGFEHRVYTHSYLCFGRDQMLSRLLARLVQRSPAPRVRHPCYHGGYVGALSLAPLYESPCVQAAPRPDFPLSLPVEGTGNPGACVSAIRELFNFSSCRGREDCAFNGVYQPPVRGRFYVEAAWPGQQPWLRDHCASALYILTLLLEGHGFSEETWPGIEFRKQAGGADIGWTLGYMLNLTNMIPAEAPAQWRAQSPAVWVAGVVLVALTLVAVLAVAVAQLLWPRD